MRLVSYNIHKGIGGLDRRYRLERVWEVIAELEADLLCLQEVTCAARRTRFDNQPRLLAGYFKAHDSCYQTNVRYRRGGYGNLILSRWPIVRRHDVSLRLRRRKPRGALLALVDAPHGLLHLANWHLGLRAGERQWQARRLLEFPDFVSLSEHPTLIVGDCNDGRNRLQRQVLRAHAFAQATSPARAFRSFPALLPVLALDRVFHRGAIAIQSVRVVNTPLARRASDHLPLVVDFQLTTPAPVPRPPDFSMENADHQGRSTAAL
jgi:endonuclease/exonuclease/phosphatase family metal-dependent hydrolase